MFLLPELQDVRQCLPVGVYVVEHSIDVARVLGFSSLDDVLPKLMDQLVLWTMVLQLCGVVLRELGSEWSKMKM